MSERLHIGFFGCRNVGKSSLVNCITNQNVSVVSDTKGTTTDAVKKTMELLPLGKVLIIDTPGYDDIGELGEKRIEATKRVLRNCDIAILVTEANRELNDKEKELIKVIETRNIPYIIVKNKADTVIEKESVENIVYTSCINRTGIEEVKNKIRKLNSKNNSGTARLVGDFIHEKDIVVLVTPIDSSAPKDRLILPQQMAIRDIIDQDAICVVTKDTELKETLESLKEEPALVITDSQVFQYVSKVVPENISLTSFSILMARYRGFLNTAVRGAEFIPKLKNGDKVLICEGCTHHRQCEDIGTVKIPKLLGKYTGKKLEFEWTNGMGFPDDLEKYNLVIHCGGCMLNTNEMQYRMETANKKNIPFTNYGIAIAYMNNILDRSIRLFIE